MWNLFPKGMFLENLMTVAKRELAWEVDYLREAECTKKFKAILMGYDGFYVPFVVGKALLSTKYNRNEKAAEITNYWVIYAFKKI